MGYLEPDMRYQALSMAIEFYGRGEMGYAGVIQAAEAFLTFLEADEVTE